MLGKFFTFSRFTLFVALCISAIAAWYSVIGLTAIFAGAVIPIIIMGGILEIAKITTTVWLHRYWSKAGYAIKSYLTIAVIVLACLTSMGIFGLLSKAHLDQNVPSGDIAAKVNLIDEKIKTQRENIEVARKALAQMDSQVDQRLARGDTESGAERAVQIRRQQAGERGKLLKDISDAQTQITKLNEERAPVASQLRKVEAEVGPIKYIAALIYGDNPDITLLEKAVRWVIILIVIVFDPLAIVLILAANNSLLWEREKRNVVEQPTEPVPESVVEPIIDEVVDETPEQPTESPEQPTEAPEQVTEPPIAIVEDNKDPVHGESEEWKNKIETIENITPWPFTEAKQVETIVAKPEFKPEEKEAILKFIYENLLSKQLNIPEQTEEPSNTENTEPTIQQDGQLIETEGVTKEIFIQTGPQEYVEFDGKSMSLDALKTLHPELVIQDSNAKNEILFGNKFPSVAKKGDIYTRTDIMPHKVYKFNGGKWLEVNKEQNPSYLQNTVYIQQLISKLDTGEYDPEFLTAVEQEEISEYLKRTT